MFSKRKPSHQCKYDIDEEPKSARCLTPMQKLFFDWFKQDFTPEYKSTMQNKIKKGNHAKE